MSVGEHDVFLSSNKVLKLWEWFWITVEPLLSSHTQGVGKRARQSRKLA